MLVELVLFDIVSVVVFLGAFDSKFVLFVNKVVCESTSDANKVESIIIVDSLTFALKKLVEFILFVVSLVVELFDELNVFFVGVSVEFNASLVLFELDKLLKVVLSVKFDTNKVVSDLELEFEMLVKDDELVTFTKLAEIVKLNELIEVFVFDIEPVDVSWAAWVNEFE